MRVYEEQKIFFSFKFHKTNLWEWKKQQKSRKFIVLVRNAHMVHIDFI